LLDWGICHLGDPLEDFARSFGCMWPGGRDEQSGRLIALDKALEF
jgi:aminoglycoside phosphotransferase (APT) family kinase protein